MNGKVVLVTGSSSGIGAGIAVHFAGLGAHVVITGRNAERLKKVAEKCLKALPVEEKPLTVIADLTIDSDVHRLLMQAIDKFGRLDILVNNAGLGIPCRITDANAVEVLDQVFRLDVRSVYYLTHLVLPYLEKSKGCIVNISSIAAVKPGAGYSAYCMAKAALDMFTKCLALEATPKGVRVNSVNPAIVRTNFFNCNLGLSDETVAQMFKFMGKAYPVGRVGEPEDIAKAVAFLVSSEASFITGVSLVADGGAVNTSIPRPTDIYIKDDNNNIKDVNGVASDTK